MLPQHIFFWGVGSKSLHLIMSFHHSLALNSEVMDAFQVDHVHPLGWEHFPDMPKEGPWLGEKVNSLQSVAKNRGSHRLSPWSPQDRATAWVSFHLPPQAGRKERTSVCVESSPWPCFSPSGLSSLSDRTAGVWVKAGPLSGVRYQGRGGGQPGSQKPLPSHGLSLPSPPW